ncbi:bifunctional folylpolyglutamate synthase/dihydrofolate synthase [Parabacteroides sp. 52]|uniref:bifunctional folylpolyglutamate synthase/dihydrofolate synthase n=1 Tax=unclassified Parabacteroides TaxID=2649774 RepID=UPI0013CF6CD4|nr:MULTISPECIES: folylpolyglutamate synthase/dihydrofolate synthase family protein [unclassified Parabacteroides]MDH6533729.1 dihydrofolate synthase/folylpolyglutamate synthase [Parabacteroides sp. PM5-20]NDV54481.1 bifunctional folylpolyglutamate synthase/dihydrofolate synthase [Parabacteroides sp. 52]
MTYKETLDYLYTSTPVFQHSGASAYKPGLDTSIALDKLLDTPHQSYQTIHVAGTNGKGSVSHLLAAILRQAGYTVGLYTSPHLVDFRERIRVNGQKIPEQYVVDFVARYRSRFEPLHPSFFELTSTLAFAYFRDSNVDYAVIETGLGGRLDSTNIIHPILSIITNISPDHTQFLGNTEKEIAGEKAGIIKPGIPVVIGDVEDEDVRDIFTQKAKQTASHLYFSLSEQPITEAHLEESGHWRFQTKTYGTITGELGGSVQCKNAATVLTAVHALIEEGVSISPEAVKEGFAHVVEYTGLMGRWQKLHTSPKIICDTGHNKGGWQYLAFQLNGESKHHTALRMVIGFVNDKDIDGILALMPKEAFYYFTQASIDRALPAEEVQEKASRHGLRGEIYPTVGDAIQKALTDSDTSDFLFIGGSTFVVAEAIPLFNKLT